MKLLNTYLWGVALLGLVSACPVYGQTSLSLEQAVSLARETDPWLEGSRHREQALSARSIAAGELPDPMVSLGLANLAADNLAFDQDPMTQFKVAVSQAFPRGDSRALRVRQLQELRDQQPAARRDREAMIRLTVTRLWLENYRNREAIRLIEKDRALFEYLVDVAESSYTSALGQTRQQDLLRAQLELTRLDDRLTVLQSDREAARAQLSEWLVTGPSQGFVISDQLPDLSLIVADIPGDEAAEDAALNRLLAAHPKIQAIDQQIIASGTGVDLARQKYKPQWGVNAGYGYRDDDPAGRDRSDLLSLGVSFDLPLFTARRQDKAVEAATADVAAAKTERALALRAIRGRFETAKARLLRLSQRQQLYENRLLQEIHDQAEASLTAYTNDAGDFAEVVRARLAELNARIKLLNIDIDRLQTIAELNYFLVAGRAEGKGTKP